MRIHAHLIAWNEQDTIALTVQYYKQFCEHVFIYDNFSDDDTRNIAEANGATVKLFGIQGQLNDQEYLKVKNNCWKDSEADYVIVADCDEILYHPSGISNFLSRQQPATIIKTQGFNIYSDAMPVDSFLEIKTGIMDDSYSKAVCFNPRQLNEIDYVYGCHECKPKGRVVYSLDTAWLLHYRAIGGVERIVKRHAQYRERLSPINLRWGLGHHYSQPDAQRKKDYAERLSASITLPEAGTI